MMSISNNSINVELTCDEINIISSLLSEKISDMKNDLDNIDGHKYLKANQLHAKSCAMLDLIDCKNNKRIEQKKRDDAFKLKGMNLENDEFSLKTGY